MSLDGEVREVFLRGHRGRTRRAHAGARGGDSPPGFRLVRIGVQGDGDLVGGEVEFAALAEDPTAFDSGGTWLGALAVGEDEHAIPLAAVLWIVGEFGGGVEVGASSADAFDVGVGALLPFDHVLLVDGVVEREDGDRDALRQGCEFAEEQREHLVGDGAGLVDGDEELGGVAAFGTRVDVGVALVDTLHRGGLVAAFQATDEVAKDVAPVDDADDRLTNFFAEVTGDVAPSAGLTVCLAYCLLDDVGHLALHLLAKFLWDLFPA